MMRAFLVCLAALCLLGGVSASVSHAQARAALAETMVNARQQVASVAHSLLSAAQMGLSATQAMSEFRFHDAASSSAVAMSGFHAMAQPSTACATAVVQLNATVYTPGCMAFAGILGSLNNVTLLNMELAALCTSSCLTSLSASVGAVVANCATGDAAAFSAQISNLITTTNLVCTKDPNNPANYCITQFYTAAQGIVGKSVLSNSDLQNFCTPCTFAILNGISASGTTVVNTTGINQLCSTDPNNGKYCFVEVQNAALIFANFNISQIPQLTNAEFEPLCSPCAKKLVALSGLSTAAIDSLCVLNGQDFCIVKAFNSLAGLQSTINGGSINPTLLCSAFASFVNSVGCCADAIGAVTNSGIAGGLGFSFSSLFQLCNVADPGACPLPSYTNTFTFVILNIAFSFYQQNTAAVNAAITTDLATNLGVAASQISITSVVAAVNGTASVGIKVTVTITFNSALTSTSAVTIFTTNTQAGNFPLASVAQLGPSSRIAPASPVSASSTGASVTGGSTSPAAPKAHFSSWVLVAAAFIALLFNSSH